VQEALDRVAKNRTTITIAHRLSTIKKADKIIVMSKGTVVEQGTHEGLLTNPDGVYYNLVNAQNLTLGDEQNLAITKTLSPDTVRETVAAEKDTEGSSTEERPYKMRGFFGSFGFLLVEQRAHANWLLLTLLGAIGSAGRSPRSFHTFSIILAIDINLGVMPLLT
jgi:ATP-binding cassette, subfamily B (MDR/TAP), member 1